MNTAQNTGSLFFDKFMDLKNGVPLRHIYAGERLIASVEGNGTPVYSHPDHQRSTVVRTDSTGNVLQMRDYVAFGEKRSETASSTVKFNYTSQYEDEDTNLLYYRHRYYLPRLGRFVSADPLYAEEMDKRGVNSQELNLYAYVRNNPVNGIDPEGYAGFAIRELQSPFHGTNIPISESKIDKIFNTELLHEQVFYHDTMESVGHGDKGPILNESFSSNNYIWRDERPYNDNLMRMTVLNTPLNKPFMLRL